MTGIEGVYSVVASGPTGSSIGVIVIEDGRITGNDSAGSRYGGTGSISATGAVLLDVTMSTPPGVFHIWSGSVAETFQTREIMLEIPPATFENGRPHELPSYGVTVIFRRVPADNAVFAGRDGLQAQMRILEHAERAWIAHDAGYS